jgi:hypothetical protein
MLKYFNIIEWGPNVYVELKQVSFIFKKHLELSLNECLYLARIIP